MIYLVFSCVVGVDLGAGGEVEGRGMELPSLVWLEFEVRFGFFLLLQFWKTEEGEMKSGALRRKKGKKKNISVLMLINWYKEEREWERERGAR